MRAGTDAIGRAAITAAADFITASLEAKGEVVNSKSRERIERDVAGTFAWLVTRYRLVDDESGRMESLAKKFLVGALEVDDMKKWMQELTS